MQLSVEGDLFQIVSRIRKGDDSLNIEIESSVSLTSDSWESGGFTETSVRIDDAVNPGYEFITYQATLGDERSFARLHVSR